VPVTGGKGEKSMKKKTTYESAPADITESIITSETIEDFLPAPEFLVKKEENIKITISLSKSSIDFFKEKAEKAGVPYQTMIKSVIDRYSSHYRKQK
jgi:predicted DNA binding CopG/RHH family protein